MHPITLSTSFSHALIPDHFLIKHEEKKPGLVVRLIHKLANFVKKIFTSLLFWKKESPFNLSKRQIRMIRQAEADRMPPKARLSVPPSDQVNIPTLADPKPGVPEDPSLSALSTFIQDFSEITVCECVYEDKLLPQIPDWQKQLTDLIAQIPESNRIFLNLKQSAHPFMKGLQALDDPAVTLIIQQLLNILVSQDKEDVEKMLLEKLALMCENGSINEEQKHKAQSLIEPVLSWLYHSNNWIVKTPQPTKLHHFISDSFQFVHALSLEISEDKLAHLFEQIKDCIETDFESTILDALKKNTPPISLMLAGRLSELIEHMPYTETYNLILHQIVLQMDAWIDAERRRVEQESLIADSRRAMEARAMNAIEVARQRTAENLLHLVESDGGEKGYLEREFHKAFSPHQACHPKMASLFTSSDNEEKELVNEEIWREMVDKIFPQIFPSINHTLPHGLVIELNGISKLLESFDYPENLKRLKDLCKAVFEQVLKRSDVQDKENFREYFFALSRLMIAEIMQSKIKKTLAIHIRSIVENLGEKKYLDYLAVEYIFPNLIDKTFEGFVRAHLERNTASIADYFLYMLQDEENSFSLNQSLLQVLFEVIQKKLIDFSMEESEIDRERFDSLIQPVIHDIHQFLLLKKQENPSDPLTLTQVKTRLKEYFKVETVAVNGDYGRLIVNALFKIGNFGGPFIERVISLFQGSLSELTSQSMHLLSDDYTLLIDSVVETARKKLLTPEAIRETLFHQLTEEETIRQEDKVRTELPKQTKRIAAIVHDSLYRSLEARSIPFIKHLTPTTEKINSVVEGVFHNFFKRPELNKNLVVSVVEIINRAFTQSEKKMDEQRLIENRDQGVLP